MKKEIIVSLKIPDTTRITAQQALNRMGVDAKLNLRADYYAIDVEQESVMQELANADVIVNANKHKVTFEKPQGSNLIVMNKGDDGSSLLHTLSNRLEIRGINSIRKGVLWNIEGDVQGAQKALLVNDEFQEFMLE